MTRQIPPDDAIRSAVTRLSRPHRSGGVVIERAAILAEGADSTAIFDWILAHAGRPEAAPTVAPARGSTAPVSGAALRRHAGRRAMCFRREPCRSPTDLVFGRPARSSTAVLSIRPYRPKSGTGPWPQYRSPVRGARPGEAIDADPASPRALRRPTPRGRQADRSWPAGGGPSTGTRLRLPHVRRATSLDSKHGRFVVYHAVRQSGRRGCRVRLALELGEPTTVTLGGRHAANTGVSRRLAADVLDSPFACPRG